MLLSFFFFFFFFNDTATTEIYTLSLHDALPICAGIEAVCRGVLPRQLDFPYAMVDVPTDLREDPIEDRKSTRLNSSHLVISYAVFCLKKKKKKNKNNIYQTKFNHAPAHLQR